MDKVKLNIYSKSQTYSSSKNPPVYQRKKKKNARIICKDQSQFWVTQKEFWNWFREKKVEKISDSPLTGRFIIENDEKMIILANTVLNLSCPNHLNEALSQRKFRKQ